MNIDCPNCSTKFSLDAALLGPLGRRVKCSVCGHQWYAQPGDAAPDVPSGGPAPAFAGGYGTAAADDFASVLGDTETTEEAPRSRSRSRPAEPRKRGRGTLAAALVAAGLLIGALIAVAAAARDQIVALWPPSLQFYSSFGIPVDTSGLDDLVGAGLEFADLQTEISGAADRPELIISGFIENTSDQPRIVPTLRVILTDQDGTVLMEESFSAGRDEPLPPGAAEPFEVGLVDWPAAAVGVEVTVAQ